MADEIRFYMDQHIPAPVSQGLRHRGVDVLTSQEAQNCGASDAARWLDHSFLNLNLTEVIFGSQIAASAVHRCFCAIQARVVCQDNTLRLGRGRLSGFPSSRCLPTLFISTPMDHTHQPYCDQTSLISTKRSLPIRPVRTAPMGIQVLPSNHLIWLNNFLHRTNSAWRRQVMDVACVNQRSRDRTSLMLYFIT